jgi:TP901 family phage tail tape measure protein
MSEMMSQQVNIAYTADTTQYQRTMGEAIATTQQYAKVADGAVGVISKLGIAMTRYSAGGGPASRQMMRPAVQEASAFQQSMAGIEARSKAAGNSVGKMSEQVRKLARDLPVGTSGAAQQIDVISKMGISDPAKVGKIAEQVVKLGAATNSLNPAFTSDVVQFQRAFGQMDAEQFSKMGDALTTVSAKMGASAQGTIEFANQIAPLAKTAGMTQTQILGVSAAFDRLGQDGYRGATVFNKAMTDMDRAVREGTPTVGLYAAAAGKSVGEFQKIFKANPAEAMTQFFEGIQKGGNSSLRILDQLGLDGPRALSTVQAIAQGGGLRQAIGAAQTGFGNTATDQSAEEAFGGLNDKLSITNDNMKQMVEASGRPMIGFLTKAAGAASGLSGAFADLVGSSAFQTMMTIGFGAKLVAAPFIGSISALTKGVGLMTALPGLYPAAKGGIGFLNNNKKPLMWGGLGAAAAGAVMDNPMLGLAGTAAFTLAQAPGTLTGLQKAVRWGINAGVTGPYEAFNSHVFGKRGKTDQIKDLFDEYGMKDAAESFSGDLKAARKATKGFANVLQQGITDPLEHEARLQGVAEHFKPGGAGNQVNLARLAASQGIRRTGAAVGNIAWAGMGALASPIGLGVAGALGAGFLGYKAYQTSENEHAMAADISGNTAKMFSERMGIALKPINIFESGMSSATDTIKDFSDALGSGTKSAIDDKEARDLLAQETKVDMPKGMTADELYRYGLTAVGGQGYQAQGQFIQQVSKNYDTQTANDLAKRMREGGDLNNPSAMTKSFFDGAETDTGFGSRPQDLGVIGKGIDWISNLGPGNYGGREQMMQDVRSLGTNQSAIATQTDQIQGTPIGNAQRQKMVAEHIRQYAQHFKNGSGDPELEREYLKSMGVTDEKAQEIADRLTVHPSGKNLPRGAWNPSVAPGGSPLTDSSQLDSIVADAGAQWNMTPEEVSKSQSQAMKNWDKSTSSLDSAAKSILQWQQKRNLTVDQMQSAFASTDKTVIGDDGKTYQLPDRIANNTAAQLEYQSVMTPTPSLIQAAAREAVTSGGRTANESIFGSLNALASGSIGQGTDRYNKLQAQISAGQLYGPEQQAGMTSAASALQIAGEAQHTINIAKRHPESQDAQDAGMMATQMQNQAMQQINSIAKQKIEVERNYQIQSSRANEDFYIGVEHMEEDFYQQREWQIHDYHRQVRRATENFNIQQQRVQEDFDRQMRYQAEDTAKSMVNSYERMAPSNIWSAGGLAANMEQQNDNLDRQVKVLADLKNKGLSQKAVDILGLADPNNALQTMHLVDSTSDDLKRLNKDAAKRAALGKASVESDDNVSSRRSKEQMLTNSRHALEDFTRTMKQSDQDFRQSLDRQSQQLFKTLTRNREEFHRSMKRLRKDTDRATEEIVVTWSDSLGIVTGKQRVSGADWQKYTKDNLDGIVASTDTGTKEMSGLHRRALDWVWRQYRRLGIDGMGPEQALGGSHGAPKGATSSPGGRGTPPGGGGSHSIGNGNVSSGSSGNPKLPELGVGNEVKGTSGYLAIMDRSSKNLQKVLEGMLFKSFNSAKTSDGSIKSGDFKHSHFSTAHMMPNAIRLAHLVSGTWPQIKTIGGWRPTDPYPDHPSGHALDIMMPNGGSGSDKKLGDAVADYMTKHQHENAVKYVMWRQHVWTDPKTSWRKMEDRGSPTANHMDHVHVTTTDAKTRPLADVVAADRRRSAKAKHSAHASDVGAAAAFNLDAFIDPAAPQFSRDSTGQWTLPQYYIKEQQRRAASSGTGGVTTGVFGRRAWFGKGESPDSRALKYMRFLMMKEKAGITAEGAAGIVGNLMQENNLNTDDTVDQAGNPSYGMIQWSGSRRPSAMSWVKSHSRLSTWQAQLDFLVHELKTNSRFAPSLRAIRSHKNPADIATTFMNNFESPDPTYANEKGRRAWALGAYNRLPKITASKNGGAGGWQWPFAHTSASTTGGGRYGDYPHTMGGASPHFHAGTDMTPLSGSWDIRPIGPGKVKYAGYDGGYGNYVTILHADGRKSGYGHLEKIYTHAGARISLGDHVGKMGSTGGSTGPHLHLNISTTNSSDDERSTSNPFSHKDNLNPVVFLRNHGAKGSVAMMAKGGVVERPTYAMIGEAHDREAVIPLNAQGVGVIAAALARYASTYEARAARTAQRGLPVGPMQVAYHSDHSTNFTGDVHVRADDPNKMSAELQRRARSRRLISSTGTSYGH